MAAPNAELTREARAALSARKLEELSRKLASIELEFRDWLAHAEAGGPLRKHRSQIVRLTDQLCGMSARVSARLQQLETAADPAKVVAECRTLQMRMLEVHRLWDYFRSKLNLRHVEWFRDYLAVADEFAWACYAPAQAAAVPTHSDPASLRTAPLVFFSGDFSPYTDGRATRFDVEEVPGALNTREFLDFTQKLPIPVIGVPWYQVAHLPDAVLIAHEVGHDVEDDFGLEEGMKAHLAGSLDGAEAHEQFAWEQWRKELFADLYGVLCAGPAFVSALADLLATDPVHVAAEDSVASPFEVHPPASLRMAAATTALSETGFSAQAHDQMTAWTRAFPPLSEQDPLREQVPAVVRTLLAYGHQALGNRSVYELDTFPFTEHAAADAAKDAALLDMPPPSDDIRALVAGARLAFDEAPRRYSRPEPGEVGAQHRIIERVLDVMGDQPRGRLDGRAPTDTEDRQAGAALFDLLEPGHPSTP